MDNQQLNTIFNTLSTEISGDLGRWQFIIDKVNFICLTDELHNRMRIIAPISKMEHVDAAQVQKCMEANFHTALDSRYAISEGILWSAFIHPLKELTEAQVVDAVNQVYSAAKTFGTYYSSGSLSFPTNKDRKFRDN